VRASTDGVAVAVQSGTVEVATSKGDRHAATLTRGERLTIDRAGVVAKSEVAPNDIAAWRERRLVVDGATLGEVVEELGRHHPGAIVLRDRALAARRVTGVFDLSRPLEALQTVVGTQRGSVTQLTHYLLVISGP
jgi:transmembrane sensor